MKVKFSTARFPLVLWVIPLTFGAVALMLHLFSINLRNEPAYQENITGTVLFVLFVVVPLLQRRSAEAGWDVSRWKKDVPFFLFFFPLWVALNLFSRQEGDFFVPSLEFWHFKGWVLYVARLMTEGWRFPLAGYIVATMPFRLPCGALVVLFALVPELLSIPLRQTAPGLLWWLQLGVSVVALYWLFARKNALFALWLYSWGWFFPGSS